MKNIITNEAKQFILVKVDANGEPEGVLTRRASRYGSNTAVSPFSLESLATAIKTNEPELLQYELDNFLRSKRTYKYSDFKIIGMQTQTTITFNKEIPISNEKERIINNNRQLILMAREWGKEWRKANPEADAETWVGRPYGSELVVNPSAIEYYKTKLAELNWKEDEDYNYSAQGEAYSAFLKKIRYSF